MSGRIVATGHICLDITPVFLSKKEQSVEKLFKPGRLIEMQEVHINTGGSVANTGLALKVLKADVSLMGKIGNDEFGQIILHNLKKYDADKEMIISDTESTSYSIVVNPPGIDRIFLHNVGANHTFCYEDLDFNKIEKAELFHFGYPTAMRSMFVNDGAELVKIFKKVKSLGVLTSLDMAMIDEDSESGKCDWELIMSKVLPYVDYFVPSVEELCYMIDKPRYDRWLLEAGNEDITGNLSISGDLIPLSERLVSLGATNILIKCGAAGMFLRTSDGEMIFEKSYKPDRVLSGTGAGDSSIAAFLKAVTEGYSMKECVQFAAATGASCVTSYDALSGLKSFEELKEKIDNGWEKQDLIKE